MTYHSVFDWSAVAPSGRSGRYRVYASNQSVPLMQDAPRCAPGVMPTRIGVDINQALCPLPPDARFTGWSDIAVGQLCRLPNGMAGVSQGMQFGVPGLGNVGSLNGMGFVPVQTPNGTRFATTQLGQVETRPLSYGEAIFAGIAVSVVSGLISNMVLSKLLQNVRIPVPTPAFTED